MAEPNFTITTLSSFKEGVCRVFFPLSWVMYYSGFLNFFAPHTLNDLLPCICLESFMELVGLCLCLHLGDNPTKVADMIQ